MTYHELRSKCKRQSDYIITLFVTNEVSLLITWLLLRTRIIPNQVTAVSILCEFICALFYASGHFLAGSAFYFLAHVLDCTDGNLARAKEIFSPLGRWFDFVGDRIGEVFIFLGISVYFYRTESLFGWMTLTMLDSILVLLYYYIVDIGLSLGVSTPRQNLTSKKFKDVQVKWGLYEPIMYGLIVLTPLGLLKLQIVLTFVMLMFGFTYQIYKNYLHFKSL